MERMGRRGGYVVFALPHHDTIAALPPDEVLTVLRQCEQVTAAIAGLSAVGAGVLARGRREEALAELGPDAARSTVEREVAETKAAVVDEIRLATGLGLVDARARVDLGVVSSVRAGRIRTALTQGECTWVMARLWEAETRELPAEVADRIADIAVGPTRDGSALSFGVFKYRLGRETAKYLDATKKRDFDLNRRDAYATLTPHGTGEILVSGAAERVQGAIQRIDELARAVRRCGDPRTLGQLRSDICLDLLIFGDIPGLVSPLPVTLGAPTAAGAAGPQSTRRSGAVEASTAGTATGVAAEAGSAFGDRPPPADATRTDAPHTDTTRTDAAHTDTTRTGEVPEQTAEAASREMPAWVRYFPGGMPPAEIRVIVPFATLIGDDDHDSDCDNDGDEGDGGEGAGVAEEPGTLSDGTALPADVVRDLAFAAGSTWRRLVTDPITGEAIELSTSRYEPPPRLREAIQIRDGTCRAPGSMIPAERCDLDHDQPWAHGGATCAANLSAKSRRAHGHKTRGQWSTEQLSDGTIIWTTGTGRQYTTYPMQYDTSSPGRSAQSHRSGYDEEVGPDGTLTACPDLEQGPPIDYRTKGSSPTTRPAPARPGRRTAPTHGDGPTHRGPAARETAARAPQPDPGPPPF